MIKKTILLASYHVCKSGDSLYWPHLILDHTTEINGTASCFLDRISIVWNLYGFLVPVVIHFLHYLNEFFNLHLNVPYTLAADRHNTYWIMIFIGKFLQ